MSEMKAIPNRQVLSKIALSLFLLSMSLSIRKVLFIFSPDGSGVFNEYTDISLYLSDTTLLFLFITVILENKKSIMSILWWKNMFHVEHMRLPLIVPLPFLCWSALSIFWSKSYELAFYALLKLFEGYFLYASLLIFIVPRGTIHGIANIFKKDCSTWNNSDKNNVDDKLFHVEQLSITPPNKLAFLKNVPRGTIYRLCNFIQQKCSTWNIWQIIFLIMIISGFLEGFLSILQFISQSSFGLTLLRESIFSASQTGIAKIIINNYVFIRPYGLFPHPNILGGFLGITMLFTITYPLIFRTKMFHVEQLSLKSQNVPRGTLNQFFDILKQKCSTWNNYQRIVVVTKVFKGLFHVEQSVFIYRTALFIQAIGFLLTFSKSAYFGFSIGIIYYLYRLFHVEHLEKTDNFSEIVPRGTINSFFDHLKKDCSTWNNKTMPPYLKVKLFHVEQFLYVSLFIFVVSVVIFFFYRVDWHYFIVQPVRERIFFGHEFFSVMSQYPMVGVGIGQSVFLLQDFFLEKLMPWQFQPVHSLYLLILVETGLIGFILLLFPIYLVLYKAFSKNVPRGTWQEEVLNILLVAIGILVATISLFDHYFWDIQQGQLLLWLFLGLLVSTRFSRY